MKKILITGGGGFIGGHLVKELLNRGYEVRAVDVKKFEEWYQCFQNVENFCLDMSSKENCYKMVDGVDEVIKHFQQSLTFLNKSSVNGLLIHNINEIEHKNFNTLFKELTELKRQGLVNKIGFSIYTPEQVDFLLKNFDFDLIQVPFNIFDNRLIQGGQLQALNNKGIEVHARSVFLQGVLLDFNNLSNYFSPWKKEFSIYQETVKDNGLSLLECALNFVLNIREIDKVLVGVNSERQLKEIIQAVKRRSNLSAYPINDINLLNPSLWKI